MDAQAAAQVVQGVAQAPAQMTPQQTLFFAWAQFGVQTATVVFVVKLLWEVRRMHHRFALMWNWFKREHNIDDSEE